MRLRHTGAAALLFGLLGTAACPRGGGSAPQRVPASGWGLGADVLGDRAVGGIAAAGEDVVVADGPRVRRIGRDGAVRWTVDVAARAGGSGGAGAAGPSGGAWSAAAGPTAGALAIDGDAVAVAIGGSGDVLPGLAGGMRGEPGAAIAGFGAEDGAARWMIGAGSSRWVIVRTVSGAGDGFLVAGSFAGTLRVGDRTVTSAGNGDGFVASIDHAGAVRWLRRMGGDGPDGVHGAGALGAGRVAIAGTFTGPAELSDTTLAAVATNTATSDGFVAVMEPDGRIAWARTWGSTQEDTCAGLAVLRGGAIAVAGTARGEIDVAGRRLDARGPADGLVAVFAADATVKGAWLVGGDDFDGITQIGGAGDRVAVAGWFTAALPGPGGTSERSDGVDDVFVAIGDAGGLAAIDPVASPGPASATTLAVTDDGWRLAVHAAEDVRTGGDTRAAGAAIWFRGW